MMLQPVLVRAEAVLEYIGSLEIPKNTYVAGTTVGGLSGITYDRERDVYYAVTDGSQAGGQRFYTLKITFKDGKPGKVNVAGVTKLKTAKGALLEPCDTEGIVLYGDNSVWISNEGNEYVRTGDVKPWVRNFALGSGKLMGECELPAEFKFKTSPDDPQKSIRGVFNNQSLETMAASPDGKWLYTANELALIQDRELDIFLVRVLRFAQQDGKWKPNAERLYRINSGGFFRSLSDMTTSGNDGKLLSLERRVNGFSLSSSSFGFTIYEIDFNEAGATDVLGTENLENVGLKTLTKKQIFDSDDAGIPECDNVEGLCLGPVINGRQSVVLVADDNFSPKQANRIHILLYPKR